MTFSFYLLINYLPRSLSLDVTGFFIHFSQEVFDENKHLLKPFGFLQFLAHPIVTIPEEEQAPILYLFNRLYDLYNSQDTDLNTLVWYLQVLLTEINQFALALDAQLEKVNTAAKITERYKDALTQFIHKKADREGVRKNAFCNSKLFKSVCKKHPQ